MMRWVLITVVALVAISAGAYITGLALPRAHVAVLEGVVARPVGEIAAAIRDVQAYPTWRVGVAIENLAVTGDGTTYVEVAEGERIAYRLTEPTRDQRFVAAITDPNLPFGGAWTITLTAEGAGVRVRIEERGEIRDPVYRLFAHFVFGYTSSLRGYLVALGATDIRAPAGTPVLS